VSESRHDEPVPSADDVEVTVGPLPDPVRARVIALAADGLGRMPVETLPTSLKRVASFAPGRRAKLAGRQIAGVLETDADFRDHLARQIRSEVSEIAQALEAGTVPAAADPVELAAVAYLLRPEGWAKVVTGASETVSIEHEARTSHQENQHASRLRRQMEAAVEELKDLRQRHRGEIAAVKAENADLRRKLGESRSRVREAEASAERARADLGEARESGAAAIARLESEARRLRARIEELDSELTAARRAERAERGTETLRARLLLDTLLDTAQGLRRELALPAVTEGSPADSVEAHLGEQGVVASSGHGSLGSDDPAMLDALLALPRAHMIVDGYNVTKTTWPELSLEKQRDRLLGGLAPLVARSGAEVTVVFDAAEKKDRPLVNRPRGVRVLFSPHGVIADDIIRELVAAEPQGRPVVVVSSDQQVARDVKRAGARSVASPALGRLLARA
jgi:predicted RNA-binding protein with PIN domain